MAPKLSKDATEKLLFEISSGSEEVMCARYGGGAKVECCEAVLDWKKLGRSATGVASSETVDKDDAKGVPFEVVIVGTSGERMCTGKAALGIVDSEDPRLSTLGREALSLLASEWRERENIAKSWCGRARQSRAYSRPEGRRDGYRQDPFDVTSRPCSDPLRSMPTS